MTSDVRKIEKNIAEEMLDDIIGLNVPFYTYSKSKLNKVKEKYRKKGIEEKHIAYAFSEIHTKKEDEVIIEKLTSDYRKISEDNAQSLLKDLRELQGNYFFVLAFFTIIGSIILFGGVGFLLALVGLEKTAAFSFLAAGSSFLMLLALLFGFAKSIITKKKSQDVQ